MRDSIARRVSAPGPLGQVGAEHRRSDRVHVDAVAAPFAGQRLAEQVDGGLGRGVGAVAARQAEPAPGGGEQHHLAALALLDEPPAGGLAHQPGGAHVGALDLVPVGGVLVDDQRDLVQAGGGHHAVQAAVGPDRRGDHGPGVSQLLGAPVDQHRLAAELLDLLPDRLQLGGVARGECHAGAGRGQRQRGDLPEGAGRPGDQDGAPGHVEQRPRVPHDPRRLVHDRPS
jgi:hypothetical protein